MKLTQQQLEAHLWGAANILRGKTAGQDYKNLILPLNVFYGAGVPAGLLILRRNRPAKRRDKVLLVYATRHYRELSSQNELRPQDVMRMLVHYHAYGAPAKVAGLVAQHSRRIHDQIEEREREDVELLMVMYQEQAEKLVRLDEEIRAAQKEIAGFKAKAEKKAAEAKLHKQEAQRAKPAAKIAERDERITEARRRAEEGRGDVLKVGKELVALYADPDELLKHARVVVRDEAGNYRLEAGDVLMTEGGDLDKIGRGALWEGQIPKCLH